MAYKNEAEVRAHAEQFITLLNRNGIEASIVEHAFRDYMGKLNIRQGDKAYGNVNVYYSPKKNTFTLKTHELRDPAIGAEIERLHQALQNPNSIAREDTDTPIVSGFEIYVDGSFSGDGVGYGVVILRDGQVQQEISGQTSYVESRQVGGEIVAVMEAVKWCADHNVTTATVYYDFENLERWATGEYRANTAISQKYVATLRASGVDVTWRKVRSHTGVYWNERADQLAKQGAIGTKTTQLPTLNAAASDPLVALEERCRAFMDYLTEQGISSDWKGIINQQHGRIAVLGGIFDLYNTPKKPFHPYLHDFANQIEHQRIALLWETFRRPSNEIADHFKAADLYYNRLKPYANMQFDFYAFAEALAELCGSGNLSFDADTVRYDFVALEKLYWRIKESK